MFTMKATNKQQLAFLFKKNFSPSFDYSTLLGVENRGGNKEEEGSRIRTLVRPAVLVLRRASKKRDVSPSLRSLKVFEPEYNFFKINRKKKKTTLPKCYRSTATNT
jgi:hypothetical protein